MVASGIGVFVIVLLTMGAVISEGLKETLKMKGARGKNGLLFSFYAYACDLSHARPGDRRPVRLDLKPIP